MSLWDDIFGQGEEQSSSGTQNRTTRQNRYTEGNLFSSLLDRVMSQARGTQTRGDAQSNAQLGRLSASVPAFLKGFSKDQAILDSKEGVTAAINEILNSGLGDVRSENTVAGGYDSTATKLLRDNVVAQAAAAGAKVRQDTIKDYASINEAGANVLTNILGLRQDSTIVNEQTEDQTSSSEGHEYRNENEFSELYDDLLQQGKISGESSPGLVGGLSDLMGLMSGGKKK
jgi:hypothetical protein